MKQHSKRLAALAGATAFALAGCGGGGGDSNGSTGGSPGAGTSEVPFAASQTVAGLVSYLNDLIATGTNGTSEPVVLGDVVLPTSETSEPL
jgi:hypothetical protein